MFRTVMGVTAAALLGLVATAARAQATSGAPGGAPEGSEAQGAPQTVATPLADACIALLRGEMPPVDDPATLRPRCESLLRASVAQQAQPRRSGAQPTVQPGQASEPPQLGESARAAFEQAGRELVGRGGGPGAERGMRQRGPTLNRVTTNPIGWFSGLGMNLTVSRALEEVSRLSWVVEARYARANASTGNITTFGFGGGADVYVIGGNNEGLRIGPRLEVAVGDDSIGGNTTFARLGASGELGYDFIASNGLALSAAGGLGGRLAGDEQNEEFTSFTGGELGPYLKLGLGFAW